MERLNKGGVIGNCIVLAFMCMGGFLQGLSCSLWVSEGQCWAFFCISVGFRKIQ